MDERADASQAGKAPKVLKKFILKNVERAANACLPSEIMFWTRITAPQQAFHNSSSIIVLLIEAMRDKEV